MDVGVTFDREEERIQEQYRLHYDERARVPGAPQTDGLRLQDSSPNVRSVCLQIWVSPKVSILIPRGYFYGVQTAGFDPN